MKKILLSINGISPGQGLIEYAMEFCQRMKAELVILQIIDPKQYRELANSIRKTMSRTNSFFESSLAAAALAESGDHSLAREYLEEGRKNVEKLLTSSEKRDVKTTFEQRIGSQGEELYNYLDKDQDVVIALYDGEDSSRIGESAKNKNHDLQTKIPFRLGIPLVKFVRK